MIYVTGDTHATMDIAKIRPDRWPAGQGLTRADYLLICGDFGAVWNWNTQDHELLGWYEAQPWTTLWVDGNHENHDIIDSFEVTERFGGRVQEVPGYPHVIHLMRGEVYDLPVAQGQTVRAFVMGGAPSIDRDWRIEGRSWWAREMPSDEEYARATECLERVNWQVDYVFTHELPHYAVVDALDWQYRIEWSDPPANELSGFLQYVDERLSRACLRMWYAGHYHVDRLVRDRKHCVLYHQVVPLGEAPREEQ